MRPLQVMILGAALVACSPKVRQTGDDGTGDDGSADAAVVPVTDAGPTVDGTPVEPEISVYAHTAQTLYRIDPHTLAITLVGNFQWPGGGKGDGMTDIAIDQDGEMIGISFTSVYRVDPMTAQVTLLSSGLSGFFNGLSFVPGDQLGDPGGPDVLVATRDTDGQVFRVEPTTGATTPIGNMGGFSSSGDVVSVTGFGTAATANGAPLDRLVKLDALTFAAHPVGTDTGYGDIWGVGFWEDQIYGFTEAGEFLLIDPATGAAQLVASNGPNWWGAAVTTRAPVIE
jgi:hypothetical protein